MTDEYANHLAARLSALEAQIGVMHTPPAEVSRQDIKRLQAEIELLRSALASTQSEITARTAGVATKAGVHAALATTIEQTVVPLVGDALLLEKQNRERHVAETLGQVHAEMTATKNAAASQAMHSADYLRARAAHFARG